MVPEPRALKTDLIAGWLVLSHPCEEDGPLVVSRRETCKELAEIASQFTDEPGRLSEAVKTWEAWLKAFQDKDDPRQAAMANTFAREFAELQEAVR